VPLCEAESVTVIAKGKVPDCEVVPEIVPVAEFKLIPGGSEPDELLHTYGAVPPVAASAAEYGTPVVAGGRFVEAIAGGVLLGGAVMLTAADAFLDGSATLVAVIVAVVFVLTAGATNSPLMEMVPDVAPQLTPTLLVPVTAEVNCMLFPEATVAAEGDTAIPMLED